MACWLSGCPAVCCNFPRTLPQPVLLSGAREVSEYREVQVSSQAMGCKIGAWACVSPSNSEALFVAINHDQISAPVQVSMSALAKVLTEEHGREADGLMEALGTHLP